MTKNEVIEECGRRLGDTSPGFLSILSNTFTFVVLELAQLQCIGSLRRTATFLFSTGTPLSGVRLFDTRTITALPAPLYPSALHRLLVFGWGTLGLLQRKSDVDFEALWVSNGVDYVGRPQIWRTYPNVQQLQVWPNPNDETVGATCMVEYTAPPAALADADPIEEIQLVDIPTVLAGLYRHGVKFEDETIRDTNTAEQAWAQGVGAMKTRLVNAEFHGRPIQIKYREV